MFTLSIPEFLTFWRAQVSALLTRKSADVVRRLTANTEPSEIRRRPFTWSFVTVHEARCTKVASVLAQVWIGKCPEGIKPRSDWHAGFGSHPGPEMYTGDWFIDGSNRRRPRLQAGWRSIHDPVLCMMYRRHLPRTRGAIARRRSVDRLHPSLCALGSGRSHTVSVTGNQRGEEEYPTGPLRPPLQRWCP